MSPRVLLINPTIAAARTARFPLAVLNLAAAVEERGGATRIVDGNVDRRFVDTAAQAVRGEGFDAVGISVMGGPQLRTAIAVSRAIRATAPRTPIIWGGHFPTICPQAALHAEYVDYVIRGQGEETFIDLMDAVLAGRRELASIDGLSWRHAGAIVHNAERRFSTSGLHRTLPYERLDDPRQYLKRTYLGRRTAAHQAALGCRFRCTFCGVAAMFRGRTALPDAARLERDLRALQERFGADSLQFYDHNFFDREVDMVPLLEVLAKLQLPWWCFARSDALLNLSDSSWTLVRRSRLRMAYIGAESPNDTLLHDVRKGTRADQTLAVVEKCRSQGVIPELSFMLAPPQDPEGETERTFEFIRRIKRLHPQTEIMLYIYTPLPPPIHAGTARQRTPEVLRDCAGEPLVFPQSADGWAEQRWLDYWCHQDAPWVSARLRRRILDFTTVLGCRFPTVTDIRSSPWGKGALRALATWRYQFRRYDRPWELDLSKRLVRLWDPRVSSL